MYRMMLVARHIVHVCVSNKVAPKLLSHLPSSADTMRQLSNIRAILKLYSGHIRAILELYWGNVGAILGLCRVQAAVLAKLELC